MAYSDIKDPSAHFQIATYTGNGGTQSITNSGNSDLKPDFIWTKSRSDNGGHAVQNSNVGAGQQIYPYLSYQEETVSGVSAFLTNGFSLGSNGTSNANNVTHVGWQWKANGGTTASNTDGTITSTVQANQDAGFSIVTYAGTGVYNKTVGHGLGVAPAVVILKNRTTGEASYDDWWVYHKNLSNPVNRALRLNETGAEQASTVFWSVVTSSTIFGVGGSTNNPRYTNGASQNYVAFCFAEKQGYSKFGKYVGNGNASGPFVYTGFKPAWVMIKRTDSADSWAIFDNKRSDSSGFNVIDKHLRPDSTTYELDPGGSPAAQIDILSNGFKQREANAQLNASGGSYIYMAFAENPFVAGGIPTTAR